jgi:predicted HTH domain antitoxin
MKDRFEHREVQMSLEAIHLQDLVKAQLYENEDLALQDALRHLLLNRPELRIQVALYRYRSDETLSIAQAAAIAGVSFERMKELLERHRVPLRLGPVDLAEARAEAQTLEMWFHADSA